MPDVARITSEVQSAPQPFPPLRRKVTFACETCRKRRVKCSGRLPCDFCTENDRICIFHDTRARRGPRPRQSASKVVRPLAPAPPRDELAGASPEDVIVVSQPTAASVEPEESDDDESENDDFLPLPAWKQGLERVLFRDNRVITDQEKHYLELVCHLLELLWRRGPLFIRSLLPAAYLLEQINLGACPRGLILAVCAYTVKYSVHRAAKGDAGRNLACQFESEARQEADITNFRGENLGHIHVYCVLAWHAASQGDGRRAWVDLSIARSLLEISATNDTEVTELRQRTQNCLELQMLYHSIGNSSLQKQCQGSNLHPELHLGAPDKNMNQFPRLLNLLSRIQQLCQRPFSRHEPPPWKMNSEFQVLQDEVRTHLIRQPRSFYYSAEAFGEHDTLISTDAAGCALAWHCCTIILSRTFLPIPERSRGDGDSSGVTTVTTTYFPGAPQLFLRERIHSCEASAAAICVIGKEVVASNRFFLATPWLGYACMQSALVLINQLHRTTEAYDERIMDNLKFAFTILRMTESFYAPAHEWIETLFRVHDINTPLRHNSENVDAAFRGYFSRFVGVNEPGFATLYPKEIIEARDTHVHHSSEDSDLPPQEVSRNNGELADVPNSGHSWLQSYVSHLDENISDNESGVVSREALRPSNDKDHDHDGVVQPNKSSLTIIPVDTRILVANPVPEITVADSNSNNVSESWQLQDPGRGVDDLYAQFDDMTYTNNDGSSLGDDVWSAMMDRVLDGNEQWAGILTNQDDLFHGHFG